MTNICSTLQEVEITALSANTIYNNVVKACKFARSNSNIYLKLHEAQHSLTNTYERE